MTTAFIAMATKSAMKNEASASVPGILAQTMAFSAMESNPATNRTKAASAPAIPVWTMAFIAMVRKSATKTVMNVSVPGIHAATTDFIATVMSFAMKPTTFVVTPAILAWTAKVVMKCPMDVFLHPMPKTMTMESTMMITIPGTMMMMRTATPVEAVAAIVDVLDGAGRV